MINLFSEEIMDIVNRNIMIMKQFETMINTADEELAEKLIS